MAFLIVVGVIVLLIAALLIGYKEGIDDTRKEAAKTGIAEYYVDHTFKKQFRWKTWVEIGKAYCEDMKRRKG